MQGKKVATIRLGKVIPKYNEMIVHSWGRPIAKIRITKVTHKKVVDLTKEDALKDGFRNLKELIKELKKVYGSIKPDDLITVIEFDIVQRFDDLKEDDPYLGLKPQDIGRLALRYLREEFSSQELKILEELGKGRSIRRVAQEITGSPTNRGKVRSTVRKALKLLIDKGLISAKSED